MGVFNLGGVIGAFKPPKLKRIYNNDALQGQIDKSIGGMDQFRSESNTAIDNYTGANRRAAERLGSLQQQSEGEINRMMGELGGSSFMSDRERTREGDLAALTGLLGQMGGGMSRGDKIAQSRLGYAGRPSSTYTDKARSSYLASFGAPLAGQIFAGLNSAAGGAAAERGANVAQRMGLMQARNDMPTQLADLELNPLRARSMARESEIGQLGGLSDVNRSNLAGFKQEQNKWAAAVGAIDEGLNSALDTALSLYSGGLMGGGGGGGLLGGLMGGGGGKKSNQAAPPVSYMGLMGGGSPPPPVSYYPGSVNPFAGSAYGPGPAYATPGINPSSGGYYTGGIFGY